MFYQDLLNFLIAWFRTRQWRKLLWIGATVFCLPMFGLGISLYGATLTRSQIAGRYLSLVSEDVDSTMAAVDSINNEDATEATQQEKELLLAERNLQVPLRRILQLGSFNERAVFLVANELARQGRLPTAVRMMREIAPAQGKGFPKGHAWLANYEMATWKSDKTQAEILLNDLSVAESELKNAQQVLVYAKLLNEFGKPKEALRILRIHVQQYPELNLPYAELAKQLGEQADFRDAVIAGRAAAEKRLQSSDGSVNDVAQLVNLALLDGKIDDALAIASRGVKSAPDDQNLKRILSEVLRLKYEATSQTSVADAQLNLSYLDAALRADPTNPAVIDSVAEAMAQGQNLSPELKAAVEASLADGQASVITHMLVANNKIRNGDSAAAIPHLELALRQVPNSSTILNNLAFAIIKGQPDRADEAAEMIDKALNAPEASQAQRASMFDTQGQIRQHQQDNLGAIESYEKAISLDKGKIATHERLAEVYRAVGMPDLAEVQMRRIKQLTDKK
ncbi:tetratricopeptide repeat protein [Aureliella helgolandensis]|uniref:Uncharacterized protein n=1 Tax=Aureliella helgolandensis TaxID=2527968 RepID=A0A518GC29_9BACT|nr:hypothetical protein [Aureliella helgolandensis]QDV26149.1 hypothetical protein Q31a_45210 [Aureliella helgolandensis]